MRIASHCQDRALMLLQVAQECPEFKDQAEFLASELLTIAALRIELVKTRQVVNFAQTHSGAARQIPLVADPTGRRSWQFPRAANTKSTRSMPSIVWKWCRGHQLRNIEPFSARWRRNG